MTLLCPISHQMKKMILNTRVLIIQIELFNGAKKFSQEEAAKMSKSVIRQKVALDEKITII